MSKQFSKDLSNKELKDKFDQLRNFFSKEEISDTELASLLTLEHRLNDPEAKSALRKLYETKVKKVCNQTSNVKIKGDVEITIEDKDGTREKHELENTILQNGKVAQAKVLTNDVEDPFDFYIDAMVFGTNGATGGTPKYVDESRSGLFGTTLLTKNVISSRDDSAPTTAILTSVISFDEANGSTLNEMALKMKNGQLYSMITFPDLNKTSTQQLTINWRISFL